MCVKKKRSCKIFPSFNTTKYFTVENFVEFSSGNESDDSFNFQYDVQIHYIKKMKTFDFFFFRFSRI